MERQRGGSLSSGLARGVVLALLALGLSGSEARAQSLDLSQLANFVPQKLADSLVLTFGGAADERPLMSGVPLNETGVGFEVGVQGSMVLPPHDQLKAGFQSAGMTYDPNQLPFIPIPRLMVHKGFGPRVNLGLSAIAYRGRMILGGDFTWAIYNPDEGITVSLRAAYAFASLTVPAGSLGNMVFKTDTWTPQVLVSRKLDFADPYLGIGYSMINGKVTVPVTVGPFTQNITKIGSGAHVVAFLGVGFRLGPSGVQLGFEGSYSSAAMHTLGARVGFQF